MRHCRSSCLAAFLFIVSAVSPLFAQHWNQLDDGLSHYVLLRPAGLQTGSFTFFFPPVKSNQTILSQGVGSPTTSKALLWGGNLNGTGSPDPVITNYGMFGTIDNVTLNMITSNTSRLTIDGSGNTTITGGNTAINGGGTLTLNVGTTTINEGNNELTINNTSSSGFAANITTSGLNGLEVHCTSQDGTGLNNNTHFIDFFSATGNYRGSIQGQDNNDLTSDPVYQANYQIFVANGVLSGVLIGLTAAAAAATADPFEAPAAIVLAATIAANIAQLAIAIAQYTIADNAVKAALGVAYTSSAGDYAEYLKRVNPRDMLYPGDIVGVKNGLISKNTEGAQAIYSVSLAPIVLGNVPPKGQEAQYNKVGFLGQVPVKVRGVVHEGDFIIASGLNDGVGVAVSSDEITPDQFTQVIGRAWTGSLWKAVKYIKVAVGLSSKAISEIVSRQQSQINALQKEVGELRKSTVEAAAMKLRMDRLEKSLTRPERVSAQTLFQN